MERRDGKPKRRKLLQNRRHVESIRAEFAELRAARARRKEKRLGNEPDVQLYRMEKELAETRWTIAALNCEVPDTPNAESAA